MHSIWVGPGAAARLAPPCLLPTGLAVHAQLVHAVSLELEHTPLGPPWAMSLGLTAYKQYRRLEK